MNLHEKLGANEETFEGEIAGTTEGAPLPFPEQFPELAEYLTHGEQSYLYDKIANSDKFDEEWNSSGVGVKQDLLRARKMWGKMKVEGGGIHISTRDMDIRVGCRPRTCH